MQNPILSNYCVKEKKPCIGWADKYFNDCLCNTKDQVSFYFGLISVSCWGIAEIPQIITNFRTKSGHGVSLFFLLTWIIGDILNIAGCLLEPATLPTQFYTAALYATGTTTLLLQTLYYDYFPKWRNGQEKELNQEVEDLIEPLRPSRQPYSAIPIPSGDNGEEAPNEVYYYISARSMAASTSSPIRSYPGPAKSVTSPDRIGNHSSSCNEAKTPNLLKKYFYKPRPIPPSVGYAAFFATLINKPHVTTSLMQVYGGFAGRRKLLQEHGIGSAYGQWSGWMMAVIYIGSRLPQIWLNIKRGNVEGLNPLMFVFALVANVTYVASILVRSIAWDKIKANMPWLLDAIGCVALDIFIMVQYMYYRHFRKGNKIEREEYVS